MTPISQLTLTSGKWQAYLELCKPRVVALMLLTSIVGMYLATPGAVALSTLCFATLGIAFVASAAAVTNHLIDRHIDRLMFRTQYRPVATGKVTPRQALLFALVLATLGISILITEVNALTAALSFATLVGYAGIYTLFLKRATPQNIVIGGAAGAAPPLLGWTAVTGHIDPYALLLVLIIFTWTPPHFWALAIYRELDYAKAKIPMLPVTHGVPFTKLCILLYTILLVVVSCLPYATGMSSWLYLIGALALGFRFLAWSYRLLRSEDPYVALKTFHFSINYLGLLFLWILLDHYLKPYIGF